jgi:uncharacterized coiled-coil protein SlyX
MSEYWPTIVTLLIGIATIVGNVYVVRVGRKKQDAETEKSKAEAEKTRAETRDQTVATMTRITAELRLQLQKAEERLGMMEQLQDKNQKRIGDLEEESVTQKQTIRGQSAVIAKQTQEIARLRIIVGLLTQQMSDAGLTPVVTLEPAIDLEQAAKEVAKLGKAMPPRSPP